MIYSSRAAIGYLVTFGDAAWSDRFSAFADAGDFIKRMLI